MAKEAAAAAVVAVHLETTEEVAQHPMGVDVVDPLDAAFEAAAGDDALESPPDSPATPSQQGNKTPGSNKKKKNKKKKR